MARLGRPGLTDEQNQEVWARWRKGESLSDIGRALEKHPASVFGVLRLFGGYCPPIRKRAQNALSLEEREEVSRRLSLGLSMRQIARELNRSPSTISREIRRNGGISRYRASSADNNAWNQARRPKLSRLALHDRLREIVTDKLSKEWSPEQIAGWLKRTYPNDKMLCVSHETIYKSLYIQSRGVLKKELQRHLRAKRVFRQSRHNNIKGISSPTSATRPDFQLILLDFDRSWLCKRLFSLTRASGKRL